MKNWVEVFILGIAITVITLGIYTTGITDGKRQTTIKIVENEMVAIHDVNFLLKEEGYKIYFRLNEGQLALVHPAQNVNYGKDYVEEDHIR